MVDLLGPFPDVEDIAMELLEELAPTVLGTDDDVVPPLIKVRRMGGTNDFATDYATLEVQVFGATRAEARDLSEAARQRLLAAPGIALNSGLVDYTEIETAPRWLDYGDPNLHRYVGMYRLSYRRKF